MGLLPVILIVGAVVLLVLLMCRCWEAQTQRDLDIEEEEESRYLLDSDNDQVSAHYVTLSQLSEGARPTNRRPGQLGHFGERPLLHRAAIMKHIHPSCNSDKEAIHFSTERDKKYKTEVNNVFKIHPNQFKEAEFEVEYEVGDEDDDEVEVEIIVEMVYISKFPCQYWECKKTPNGQFEVTERGEMYAVFRKSDCHLLIGICRETRQWRQKTHNDQVSQAKTLPQRQPQTKLISQGVRLPKITISGKRPLLHEDAIRKHIHPSCNSDREAIHFSTEQEMQNKGELCLQDRPI